MMPRHSRPASRRRANRFAFVPGLIVAVAWLSPCPPWTVAQTPPPEQQSDKPGQKDIAEFEGEVRVLMKDARSFRGEFVSRDPLSVVIKIAGIETRFDAADVIEIIRLKTFDEYYRELKTRIDSDDYEQRFQLGQWAYRRGRLEVAANELELLIDDNPSYEEARKLLRTINAELEMAEVERERPAMTRPERRGPDLAPKLNPTHLLTDDQVNLLKVYEINLDSPPRVIIPRDVVDQMLNEYAGHELLPATAEGRKLFYRKPYHEILDVMFRLQARHLYGKIRVLSEPEAFSKFRLNVHRTWLLNGCATSQCHGGVEAGDLFLFNRGRSNENVVYTNFLILDRLRIREKPLLDYDEPARSWLLQAGLPDNRSINPHPPIEGWRPVFRDESDPLFTKAVDWLRSMYIPRPAYPIAYDPPTIEQRRRMLNGETEVESSGPEESSPANRDRPERIER